jgi:hypothetical protein
VKPVVSNAAQSCSSRLPEDTAQQNSGLVIAVRFQKTVIYCFETIRHV